MLSGRNKTNSNFDEGKSLILQLWKDQLSVCRPSIFGCGTYLGSVVTLCNRFTTADAFILSSSLWSWEVLLPLLQN